MDENKWHMDEITWTFEEHKKAIEETYQRGYFDGVHSKGVIHKSEVKWLCDSCLKRDVCLIQITHNADTPIVDCSFYLDKEQEPKTGHCKDCKWWKDSDGEYRRGCRAESQCPINRKEVYEGNGYCYMYEPQESEKE